jgi:xylose dehydrogenase (NAD/NADP)
VSVRWGVIGCGSIATHAICPAIRWSHNGVLAGVASRDRAAAERKAAETGASRAFPSYEALLDSPEIDAIYIGLPTGLHAEWALRAAEAGKHVLCEKSLTLTHADASRVAAAFRARKLRLVEAFMYRHHPQWRVVEAMIARGAIGDVVAVHAHLSGYLRVASDHRWSRSLGGGALRDVTCYPVDAARFLTGREPLRARAFADRTTPEGVDASSYAVLEMDGGIHAVCSGSLRAHRAQHLSVLGSDGRIDVVRPFIPEWGETEVILEGAFSETVRVSGANHFLHQVEHFARLVLEPEARALPAEDGVANAAALDMIEASFTSAA